MSQRQIKDMNDSQRIEQLIAALTGGTEALEELYSMTGTSVYGLVFSILKNQHDSEDVVHDTFVSVYKAAAGYEAKDKPLAWIFTIAKNHAYMKLRERNRNGISSESTDFERYTHSDSITQDDRLVLEAYLKELKEEEQNIVLLHSVSGWKHREIAKFLSLPVQNVILKYNRAIKKLLKMYMQKDPKE